MALSLLTDVLCLRIVSLSAPIFPSLLAKDGPNLLTIDHPKGAAQGLFPSALPSEADTQLILVKGSANDPKRTLLTGQKNVGFS